MSFDALRSGLWDHLNKPLALALLSVVTAVGGRLISEHFTQQAHAQAQTVRIEALERQAITRAEFHQFSERVLEALRDLKADRHAAPARKR